MMTEEKRQAGYSAESYHVNVILLVISLEQQYDILLSGPPGRRVNRPDLWWSCICAQNSRLSTTLPEPENHLLPEQDKGQQVVT